MEKQKLRSFNKQLARIYWLALIHVIISVIGLLLNYVRLNSDYLYFAIIGLNVIALFCFEPWRIMNYLNEGYGYKQGLETLAQEKGVK
jgi:hypothetical protein